MSANTSTLPPFGSFPDACPKCGHRAPPTLSYREGYGEILDTWGRIDHPPVMLNGCSRCGYVVATAPLDATPDPATTPESP